MKYSVGVDLLFIPRIKKIIGENKKFLNKVYTKKELDLAKTFSDPLLFYATRFCAKEAIMKATELQYDFLEIEILKEDTGKPIANILHHPEIQISLSISYDTDYATCYVLINKNE